MRFFALKLSFIHIFQSFQLHEQIIKFRLKLKNHIIDNSNFEETLSK